MLLWLILYLGNSKANISNVGESNKKFVRFVAFFCCRPLIFTDFV